MRSTRCLALAAGLLLSSAVTAAGAVSYPPTRIDGRLMSITASRSRIPIAGSSTTCASRTTSASGSRHRTRSPFSYLATIPERERIKKLRFNQFTAGRFWVDDYGSAENADEFKALYSYSPYHNVRKGVKYPATLVTTADTDDRVVPGHSFKYIAALQAAQSGDAPVLIRIETRAGHGSGKPTDKLIEEFADQWSFLVANLHVTLPSTYGAR